MFEWFLAFSFWGKECVVAQEILIILLFDTMCRPTIATILGNLCCDFARPLLLLCATYDATLRDPFSAILRLCVTQASCGSMEFWAQKVQFGYIIRSQHESWTSARATTMRYRIKDYSRCDTVGTFRA